MVLPRRSRLGVAIGSAVTTALVGLAALNLGSGEKNLTALSSPYAVSDPEFHRSMSVLLGPPLMEGNRVTALQNGVEIFPAMLDAIAKAKRTITFETYIYWSGQIGRRFAAALAERARAGVRVHVILDWVGSGSIDDEVIEELEAAGVEIVRYHEPGLTHLSKFNNRTHRKLLVIDGRIGFTGGVGIGDQWLGNAEAPDHWRESHYRLEGPAVAEMQSAFLDNWIKTDGRLLHGDGYFPPLDRRGDMSAQVFIGSANEGSESIRLMYLLSIAAARRSIRISSAYFVPDDLAVETLISARRRGVEIDVIVPGPHTDTEVVRRASRARWGRLLEAGIRIYEYAPTMYHCKVMIIDDLWVSVGSTNFDNRSFRLNDEANLNVLDRDFARAQAAVFEEDLKRARAFSLEGWKKRPIVERLFEHAAALLRSQL